MRTNGFQPGAGLHMLLHGESNTDQRVRRMIALLMSIPEYQLE